MFLILLLLLIFFLSIVQSIFGVGLLILGTPILLLFDYSFINILFILLPSSIVVSSFYLKKFREKKKHLTTKFLKNFFLFCFPFLTISLIVIYFYEQNINYKLMIGIIIIISLLIKNLFNRKYYYDLCKYNQKKIMCSIGFLHGLTNVGGTLLSIFLLSINKDQKSITRSQIMFVYFFFAIMQYIFINLFYENIFLKETIYLITASVIGSFFGNKLYYLINELCFLKILNLLILFSGIFLILNNL